MEPASGHVCFVLCLGHGSGGLSASAGLILCLLRDEVSENLLRSELLRLERSALVQRPRFAILMLLIPVLLAATHVGEPRLLQLRGPRDACNAMVAFYMTNLSSRFCCIAFDCYYRSADVYKSSGLLDQKTSSRLDCICVCDTACVKTWNCLRQDMRQLWNDVRSASNSACASPGMLLGAFVLRTFCPENENFQRSNLCWRKIENGDFYLTQMAHHAGHQGLILAGGFDLCLFPIDRVEPLCALACFDKDLSRIAIPSDESCRTAVSEGKALRGMLSYFDSYGARNTP